MFCANRFKLGANLMNRPPNECNFYRQVFDGYGKELRMFVSEALPVNVFKNLSFSNLSWKARLNWLCFKIACRTLNPNPKFLLCPFAGVIRVVQAKHFFQGLWAPVSHKSQNSYFWPEMLCILRCQTLKRHLRWSAKPLAHWQSSIRPLSQSSTLSFRPTLRFRQDKLAPPLKEKVEPVESFYEKVGKPQIRNQVLVSRVTLLFPLSNFVSLNKVLASS